MMKQFKLWMFAAILTICGAAAFTSCADEDNPYIEEEIPITHARVDSVYHIDEANLTVYIMEYPSIDPFGRPAMLSGTITIGDEVRCRHSKPRLIVILPAGTGKPTPMVAP